MAVSLNPTIIIIILFDIDMPARCVPRSEYIVLDLKPQLSVRAINI